ncbi:hypothetical protein EDC04DRAFT_947455 [Pisolithus marmoratus]|nr:hypothetical protein EDC04DRAFT_947455 [Pisolithus marmoratus]
MYSFQAVELLTATAPTCCLRVHRISLLITLLPSVTAAFLVFQVLFYFVWSPRTGVFVPIDLISNTWSLISCTRQNSTTYCFPVILYYPNAVISLHPLIGLYEIITILMFTRYLPTLLPSPSRAEQLKLKIICSRDFDPYHGFIFEEEYNGVRKQNRGSSRDPGVLHIPHYAACRLGCRYAVASS